MLVQQFLRQSIANRKFLVLQLTQILFCTILNEDYLSYSCYFGNYLLSSSKNLGFLIIRNFQELRIYLVLQISKFSKKWVFQVLLNSNSGFEVDSCYDLKNSSKKLSQQDCLKYCCLNKYQKTFDYTNFKQCISLNFTDQFQKGSTTISILLGLSLTFFMCTCFIGSVNSAFKMYGANNQADRNQQNLRNQRSYQRAVSLIEMNKSKNWNFPAINNQKIKNEKWQLKIPVDPNNSFESVAQSAIEPFRQNSCSICLEENTNCRTLCKHYFHINCFIEWLHKNQFCPLCMNRAFNPIVIECQNCHRMQLECIVNKFSDSNRYVNEKGFIECQKCKQQIKHNKLMERQSQQIRLQDLQHQFNEK